MIHFYDLEYLEEEGLEDFSKGDILTIAAPKEREEELFKFCEKNNLELMQVQDRYYFNVFVDVEVK